MNSNFLAEHAFLTLGSRLKRLGETLQGQTRTILAQTAIDIAPADHPLLLALSEYGDMTIGELTTAMGTSQPGVTRAIAKLEMKELVTVQVDGSDRRLRKIALSERGLRMVSACKDGIWPMVEAAVKDAVAEGGGEVTLLPAIGNLEESLSRSSLFERSTIGVSHEPA